MIPALLILLAALFGAAEPALAASPWAETQGARLRLVAGAREASPTVYWAGIEIALDAGWKTYWRSPGASGLPPEIDSSASRNLGSLELLWPAPERFGEGLAASIGYKERVVLPLRITPQDPRAPVFLDLTVRYGVCEQICVPAEARRTLALFGSGPDAAAILQARAKVPGTQDGLVGSDAGFGVVAAGVARGPGGARLTFDVSPGDGSAGEIGDLLIEAPDAAVPAPERRPSGDARVRFEVPLDEALARQLSGAELVLTVVGRHRAVEQRWQAPPDLSTVLPQPRSSP